MKRLVDIVNFNPDASCLPSKDWLNFLSGGPQSDFCSWLNLYISSAKQIVLGLTGCATADIKALNPEAITLINANTDIFEIVLRPFSHDIALLRSRSGFEINVEWGLFTIQHEFENVSTFYLPPEFMVTAEQIDCLKKKGIDGLFINPARMKESLPDAIPSKPYLVKGIFESQLACIPVAGNLVPSYLETLQRYDRNIWNQSVQNHDSDTIYFWRDGESPFLIPDGIEREKFWLENESPTIERCHLKEIVDTRWMRAAQLNGPAQVYPLHPFSAWLREFRLMGFLRRMFSIENVVNQMSTDELGLWMYMINSDVLSSVEKKSPRVSIASSPGSKLVDFLIKRSDRHLEGEEFMVLLETFSKDIFSEYLNKTSIPHIEKLRARVDYLRDHLHTKSTTIRTAAR